MSEGVNILSPEAKGKDKNKEQSPKLAKTSEIPLGVRKESIRQDLMEVNQVSKQTEEQQQRTALLLGQIGDSLETLKVKYPNDPDLRRYYQMYEDLKGDVEREESPDLDTSFDAMMEEMRQEIRATGVRRELPSDTILSNTLSQLQAIGVTPDYIMTKGNPRAKIAIYFPQLHTNPGLTDEMLRDFGVLESQALITKIIDSASANGLARNVYREGLPDGFQQDRGKISLRGFEDPNLLEKDMQKILGGKLPAYRTTAENILLASSVAQQIKGEAEELSFVILGAAHEKDLLPNVNQSHILPFSSVLAYYDINVIVIDASKSLNLSALSKHNDILQKVRNAVATDRK